MVPPSHATLYSSGLSSAGMENDQNAKAKGGPTEIMSFLKEWRPLECACCSTVFGFQNRTSGACVCTGAVCHRTAPTEYVSANLILMPIPASPSEVAVENEPTTSAAIPRHINNAPVPRVIGDSQIKNASPPAVLKAPVLHPPQLQDVRKVNGVRESGPPPQAFQNAHVPSPTKPGARGGVGGQRPLQPEQQQRAVGTSSSIGNQRLLWPMMKYSENLFNRDIPVKVAFAWSPTKLVVCSEADETKLTDLQSMIARHIQTLKPKPYTPVKDEVVLAEYDGTFYRGRVESIVGNKITVIFIDYGDQAVVTEVFQPTPDIFQAPVYGLNVQLKLTQNPGPNYRVCDDLEIALYEENHFLELSKKNARLPNPGDVGESPEVLLWNATRDATYNQKLKDEIIKFREAFQALELTHMLELNPYFRETKIRVENYNREELRNANYTFHLDNADYPYQLVDLPLIPECYLVGSPKFVVTRFESLSKVCVTVKKKEIEEKVDMISSNIKSYIMERTDEELENLRKGLVLSVDDMCLVKWPRWFEVDSSLTMQKGAKKWKQAQEDYEEELQISDDDYYKHSGKWFRAACKTRMQADVVQGSDWTLEMFLVDIGKKTLIMGKDVYRMPNRFVVDFHVSISLCIKLSNIVQYDYKTLNDKWKFLLRCGTEFKPKIFWLVDDVALATLDEPRENEFDKHFNSREVQESIRIYKEQKRDHEIRKKIRAMSSKGQYDTNKKKVLAEEAEKEKLRPFHEQFSQLGTVHYDQIFDLNID